MSPPIVPAPTTCTCFAANVSSLPSPLSRSCSLNTRMRFAAVGLRTSVVTDAGSDGGASKRVAVVLHPQVEQRVRRRIVLAARALRHLLRRLRGDEAARERMQRERLRECELARRRQRPQHAARGVLHDARRHGLVDDAELLRPARVDGLAGEQQVERGRCADELRQTRHASPCRHDAEHHLGKTEARPGLVDRDAIAARECELESATEADSP